MPDRLSIDDPNLFPVQAFFNAISDGSFLRVIDDITSGVGFKADEADCTFPEELDPDEESFVGVRFSLFEHSVVVTKAQMKAFARVASIIYSVTHPEDRQALDHYLNR